MNADPAAPNEQSRSALFADVYARLFPWLCRSLRSVLTTTHDAEDVAQWAFMRAWESWDSLRDPRALSGWLKTTAYRRALVLVSSTRRLDHIRSEETTKKELYADLWPDSLLQRARQRAQLWSAVNDLSPRQRHVVRLRIEHGETFREIAERVGCTGVAARVNYTHGVGNLRAAIATRLELRKER